MVHEDENDIDFVSATPEEIFNFFSRNQASSREALKEMRFCRDSITESIGETADRLKALEKAHGNLTQAINKVRDNASTIPACAAESAQEASAES